MNILHHKSWHVRTKKNIEKVRQDERRALEEQTEKARKADIAEQERRIQELRGRFKADHLDEQSTNQKTQNRPTTHRQLNDQKGHLNFFQPEYDQRLNKAHELEKKLEKDQWEKKVGIVQYLGGNQRDSLPWYEKSPAKLETEASFKDVSILERNDPLNQIKKVLNKRKKDATDLKKKFESRVRFEKRSDKSQRKRESSQSNERNYDKSKEIDTSQMSEKELNLKMLRDKRLKREEKEANRTRSLFSNNNLFDHCLNDRERAYSNQFNPHLARK